MLRCAGGSRVTSRPSIEMRPLSARSRPAISRKVVDLPQPEGPSRTFSVPASSEKESPSTARTMPAAVVQCLLTFSTTIADNAPPGTGRPTALDAALHAALRPAIIANSVRPAAIVSRRRLSSVDSAEQGLQRRARVRRPHEGLADQEGAARRGGAMHATSPCVRMPLSVTTSLPAGTLGRRSIVVRSDTAKLRRLRLLMPTSDVLSLSARSSSDRSCTSTSTSMP